MQVISRYTLVKDYIEKIESSEGSLDKFSRSYEYFGGHVNPDNSVTWREWAPAAEALFLKGDFSKLNHYFI